MKRICKTFYITMSTMLVSVLVLLPTAHAFAASICPTGMSTLDCAAVVNGWESWVPDNGSGSSTCGTSSLVGTENEQKIFNYLVAKGLTSIATAGVMGNMQAESHFDPSIVQAPGSWEDLSDEYDHAVGLVQWDGGRRPAVIKYMESVGLTDADFHTASDKLLTAELDYVMQELNTSYKDSTFTPIQAATDPGTAAFIFHKNYEGSADDAAKIQGRVNNAIAIYAKYGSSAPTSVADSTITSSCAASPDCTSAKGAAAILCDAKKYDTTSYSDSGSIDDGHSGAAKWHTDCPVIGPSCYLDCSGLVNIAIYDVYGQDINENTDGERAAVGKYWTEIPLSQVQPGDLVQPRTTHVEIIDHVVGNELYTFAAHTEKVAQPEQVGPAQYQATSSMIFLHYSGPGSS